MSLESGTYISDLVSTNPLAGDPRSEGDDHIRLLKAAIKATFPNIAGAVTPTHTELNFVDGVTSNIQTQLNALVTSVALRPQMANGTVCLFYQASAPTGWTQVTTQNNKALRVVGTLGAGGVTGNDAGVTFSAAFTSKTPAGTIGGTALTEAQLPQHRHAIKVTENGTGGGGGAGAFVASGGAGTGYTEYTGSGSTHTHTFTGTAINLAVQYIDVILASRSS